jgi:hypothetical protein
MYSCSVTAVSIAIGLLICINRYFQILSSVHQMLHASKVFYMRKTELPYFLWW